jgi:hypothetical protein
LKKNAFELIYLQLCRTAVKVPKYEEMSDFTDKGDMWDDDFHRWDGVKLPFGDTLEQAKISDHINGRILLPLYRYHFFEGFENRGGQVAVKVVEFGESIWK